VFVRWGAYKVRDGSGGGFRGLSSRPHDGYFRFVDVTVCVFAKIIWEAMVRLPKQVANPGLAALIAGSGFRSLERFAQAVNIRGWEMCGLKLSYDHITVKRWLAGSVCQNPEVVAAVLSAAWGIPIPAQVLWPELRDGQGPVPTHLQPWVAARTLEALAAFVGSDMLTRREVLAGSVATVSGSALVEPVSRWLGMRPVGLSVPGESMKRIGMSEVAGIEEATKYFAAVDAEVGGGLSREAAVGQLKYAVDLVRYASYADAVGNRLLAAVAGLAGLVGYMCLDSGMSGPAQRYLLYGLQAARESTDARAPLLVVRILGDLAQQVRWSGDYATAARVLDLALGQLPADRRRHNLTRAVLTANKAHALAYLGPSCLPEVRGAVGMGFDLYGQAEDDEREDLRRIAHRSIDVSEPELAAIASAAQLVLAKENLALAGEVADRTRHALANLGPGYGRNRVLAQIRLARARFVGGEPDQGCDDGDQALVHAEQTASAMVRTRLREMYVDTERYRERARVRELRERVRAALA
jgi:hypothetical protein